MSQPAIGIIGGTGFYEFLTPVDFVSSDTPYGPTSAPISVSLLDGRLVAFLPRRGRHHDFLPHEIPYRANLWAMKQLGVQQIVGLNTVGSLQEDYRAGDLVLVDQFVDRTNGRVDTFFTGRGAAHISTAYPYCRRIRALAATALAGFEGLHPDGTVVVIQGPRFNTYAESRWFHEQGWHVVNMTQYPEVVLAREQEICYLNLSYITDYDVAMAEVVGPGIHDAEPVSHNAVLAAFASDSARFMEAVKRVVAALPTSFDCTCRHALDSARP